MLELSSDLMLFCGQVAARKMGDQRVDDTSLMENYF